jgi:7,8-dihydropterin-6-yl-methyl-4-(beta-D-ribofuranosyl)aminobenzene 5'-phosphate synthase
MGVKATVLCENAVYGNLGAIGEHGWSAWLETPRGEYLFDTGQGLGLLSNAAFFQKDLAAAKGVLISHHHGDHTGGLLDAMKAMRGGPEGDGVPVHAHPDLFKESFRAEKDKPRRHIGVPHTRSVLEASGAIFSLDTGWREVEEGIYMTGEVPRRTSYEIGDLNLKHYGEAGELIVDPILDDQTVVIDTEEGLFVVLGCSHAGVINILTYITEKTGKSRFHTVIGGTHLGPIEEDQIARSIEALHEFDIGRIGVSHCTGQKTAARMAGEFGERFFFCSVGMVVEA